MDTSVRDAFLPGYVHLLLQEFLILFIDVFLNGLPAGGREESRWISQKDRTWELTLDMVQVAVPSHPSHFLPPLVGLGYLLTILPRPPMDGFPC